MKPYGFNSASSIQPTTCKKPPENVYHELKTVLQSITYRRSNGSYMRTGRFCSHWCWHSYCKQKRASNRLCSCQTAFLQMHVWLPSNDHCNAYWVNLSQSLCSTDLCTDVCTDKQGNEGFEEVIHNLTILRLTQEALQNRTAICKRMGKWKHTTAH